MAGIDVVRELMLAVSTVEDVTDVPEQVMEGLAALLDHPDAVYVVASFLAADDPDVVRGASIFFGQAVVPQRYLDLTQEQQAQLKNVIVQLMQDPNPPVEVLLNNARAAATIAALEESELQNSAFRVQLVQVTEELLRMELVVARVRGYAFLRALAENIEDLSSRMANFHDLFLRGLRDQSAEICAHSLRVACSFFKFQWPDARVTEYLALAWERLPVVIEAYGFGCVNDLVRALDAAFDQEAPFVTEQLGEIIPRCLNYLGIPGFPPGGVRSILHLLSGLLGTCRKTLVKRKLVQPMIAQVFQLLSAFPETPFILHPIDLEDDEEAQPADALLEVLGYIATALPVTQTYQPIMARVGQCLTSESLHARRVGVMAIVKTAKALEGALRPHIKDLLPILFRLLHSDDEVLASCVLVALIELCASCVDTLEPLASSAIQALLPLLRREANRDFTIRLLNALMGFGEMLTSEEVKQLAPALLPQLAQRATHEDRFVQISAIQVVLSIGGHSEGEEFYISCFETVQRPLVELLGHAEKRVNTMALEMIAYAGRRIGRERFRPFFQPGMQLVLAELGRDDFPFGAIGVEQLFKFVVAAARIMDEEFAPAITAVVPALIRAADLTLLGEDLLEVDEEIIDAHRSAAQALTYVASVWPDADQLFEFAVKITSTFGFEAGGEYLTLFTAAAVAAWKKAQGGAAPRDVSYSEGEVIELPGNVQEIIDTGLAAALRHLTETVVPNLVPEAVEAIMVLVSTFGFAAIARQNDELVELIGTFLRGEARCQDSEDDNASEEEREEGDNDDLGPYWLVEIVLGLVTLIAKAAGEHSRPYLELLLPLLPKCFDPEGLYLARAQFIHALSELTAAMGATMVEYLPSLIPIIQQGLVDELADVRHVAAALLADLCYAVRDAISPMFPTLLQWLHPLCHRKPDPERHPDTDGALLAVAAILDVGIDTLPLDLVLPDFLGNLPLCVTVGKWPKLARCLIKLVQSQNEAVTQHLPKIVALLLDGLNVQPPVIKDDLVADIHQAIQTVQREHPQQFEECLAQLSPERKEDLAQRLQLDA